MIEYTIRKIRRLLCGFKGMKLVYREENSAADGFAKWVHGMDMLVISQDVTTFLDLFRRFYFLIE